MFCLAPNFQHFGYLQCVHYYQCLRLDLYPWRSVSAAATNHAVNIWTTFSNGMTWHNITWHDRTWLSVKRRGIDFANAVTCTRKTTCWVALRSRMNKSWRQWKTSVFVSRYVYEKKTFFVKFPGLHAAFLFAKGNFNRQATTKSFTISFTKMVPGMS